MENPEGAEGWLDRWIVTHGDRITQFAYSYTRDWDDAQDVAQETFLRLFRTHGRHGPSEVSPAWLYRVAHRLCIDRYRKMRAARHRTGPATGTHSGTEDVLEMLAVHDVLERLHPRDRECLWLVYYEDLSIAETAKILHQTPEAVRTRLRRARDRFRAQWKGEDRGATS